MTSWWTSNWLKQWCSHPKHFLLVKRGSIPNEASFLVLVLPKRGFSCGTAGCGPGSLVYNPYITHISSHTYILYIYKNKIFIYIYKIPLAIQCEGRTPWFCKYKAGAWPSDRGTHHYKIKGTRPFQAWVSLQNYDWTCIFTEQLTP
jgi:hypothetical protein